MDRRESLKYLVLTPLVVGFEWSRLDVEMAVGKAGAARAVGGFQPRFFSKHEHETVRVLVDLIFPADDRSGSATSVGVPEFMDFIMMDRPSMQTAMRGGLAWLDAYSMEHFEASFLECSDEARREVLDAIAYPGDADPALSHGVSFFSRFRDLTASGFWTTKEGMEDIGYVGNVFVHEWKGAPEEEMERLGLSKASWETI